MSLAYIRVVVHDPQTHPHILSAGANGTFSMSIVPSRLPRQWLGENMKKIFFLNRAGCSHHDSIW